MDGVSYAHSAKQAQRIEKFIENPDSNSGVLTQPSVIQAGETVTVPAGRTAILANTRIDGTLTVNGTVFIPSGATTTDIDTKLSTKVAKVTSTDNAIVRFDGTTGDVQNSGVIIDDAGNVGIGLTNPHSKLGVQHNPPGATGANNNTAGCSIGIDSTGVINPLLGLRWTNNRVGIGGRTHCSQFVADSVNSLALEIYTTGSSPLVFGTNSTERMRIDTSGNLLVGTTTDNGADKLQVNGSIKATELNVSANYITKVSKNVPGLSGSNYKDKYFILFKTPTWGLTNANYSVKGALIAERINNIGETVYTDFSVGCGYDNRIHKTYFQNKGNVGTSLVYVTINSIQYVAIYWYSASSQHAAWFDGFITNFNASSVIDNLCGTIFETEQNALSRIII